MLAQLAKTKRNLEYLKRTIDFAFAGSSVNHSESLELLSALRAVDVGKQAQMAAADAVFANDAALDVGSRRVMLLFQRRFLEHMSADFKVRRSRHNANVSVLCAFSRRPTRLMCLLFAFCAWSIFPPH